MIRAGPARGRAGLVMLHGRGGSAGDILGLLDRLGLPDVSAVAPDAPGQSWWPTSFLAPAAQVEPHVLRGLAVVAEAVAELQSAGIPRDAIWLLGFSQGACLALEAFARQGEGLAGVFGLSGGLVGLADAPGGADADLYGHGPKGLGYSARREGAQAWLSVHERDPHIPLKRVQDSAAALSAMGATVQTAIFPGAGHSVMRDDIVAVRARLNAA